MLAGARAHDLLGHHRVGHVEVLTWPRRRETPSSIKFSNLIIINYIENRSLYRE